MYKTITIKGKQKRLHRYIMECFLGRELNSEEIVHHKDGNKLNNCIENLELTNRSEHLKKHYDTIGCKEYQFKTKFNINISLLKEQYQNPNMTFKKLANIYGCSAGNIQRLLGKNARKEIKCINCGNKADYKKAKLCRKCYQKEYHAKHK